MTPKIVDETWKLRAVPPGEEAALRKRIVEIALTWQGTPYRDCQGLKGAGVDCAYFPVRVLEEAGLLENFKFPPYSTQMMFNVKDELYAATLVEIGAVEITEPEVQPGDLVLYKLGFSFSHGAIVIKWPEFVLHPWRSTGMVGWHGTQEGKTLKRQRRFFSFFRSASLVQHQQEILPGQRDLS